MTDSLVTSGTALSYFLLGTYFSFLFTIFTFFAFFNQRHENYQTIFAICMLLVSLSVLAVFIYEVFDPLSVEKFNPTLALFDLLSFPAFWTLVLSLVWYRQHLKSLLLFLVVTELPVIISLGLVNIRPQAAVLAAIIWCLVGFIFIWSYAYYRLHQYRRMLMNSYSNIEHKDLKWVKGIMIILPVLMIIYLVMESIWFIYRQDILEIIYYVIAIIIFTFVSYNLVRQDPVDMILLQSTEQEIEESDSELSNQDNKNAIVATGLKLGFEKTKGYLHPNITIRDAAQAANCNIRSVSAYLNDVLGKNFNQYINELRIAEAQIMLLEEPETIEGIAKRVGYTNQATFWRAFKVVTGMNPSEYKLANKEAEQKPALMVQGEAESDETVDATSTSEEPEFSMIGFVEEFIVQHPNFASKLTAMAPDISSRDLQLCMLLAIGKDNEEISQLMKVSAASLRVFRSRLRAKLGIDRKASLQITLIKMLKK